MRIRDDRLSEKTDAGRPTEPLDETRRTRSGLADADQDLGVEVSEADRGSPWTRAQWW